LLFSGKSSKSKRVKSKNGETGEGTSKGDPSPEPGPSGSGSKKKTCSSSISSVTSTATTAHPSITSFKIPKINNPLLTSNVSDDLGYENSLNYNSAAKFGLPYGKVLPCNRQTVLGTDLATDSELCRDMEKLVVNSVTKSTWSKHFSAWNCYCAFATEKKINPWPATVERARAFVVWAICSKNLSHKTVKSYLSSIKMFHVLNSWPTDALENDKLVKTLLKGGENSNQAKICKYKLSVSPAHIAVLGHAICNQNWSDYYKQLIWSACIVCYFTSCRMGELLSSNESYFDELYCLQWKHVTFETDLGVLLKLPFTKTKGIKGDCVDLFPFPNKKYCPVLAITKLLKMQVESGLFKRDMPVFTVSKSKFLTKTVLNWHLADLLKDTFNCKTAAITCKSFRTGIPSVLDATETDKFVKEWGRWSSSCFSVYTKFTREKRRHIFDTLCKTVLLEMNKQ